MKYGVNLSTVWAGMPLEEQVAKVVAAGFRTVEFWFAARMDVPQLMELQHATAWRSASSTWTPTQ